MSKRAALTEEELDRIADLREKHLPSATIAREVGCSQGSVDWALLKMGVDIHADRPLPPVPEEQIVAMRGGKPVRRFTAAEDARLLALEASGMKTYAISRELGRQNNSVIGRMRTLARRQGRAEAQA